MKTATRDWIVFLAVTAALSAAHVATGYLVGVVADGNQWEWIAFLAGSGLVGPLAGLAYVGLHATHSRPERPGRSAWHAGLAVGILAYLASAEFRAIFGS